MLILKIFIYLLLVLENGYFLFVLPKKYPPKKLLKFFGIGTAITYGIMIIGIWSFLAYCDFYDWRMREHEQSVVNFFMAFVIPFFVNAVLCFFTEYMIPQVGNFHKKYNSANLDRQPIKFLIVNTEKIKLGYRIAFFLGSFLMFYGALFGSK